MALASSGAAPQVFASPAQSAQVVGTRAQRVGREAISAAYTKINKALATGNFAANISYFAPNYSVRGIDGKVRNRAQSVAALRKPLGVPLRFIITRRPLLTWRGKDALVTYQLTAIGNAKVGARTIPLRVISQSRDLWTLTPRGWKIRQSVTTGSEIWLNGKRKR